MNQTLNLVLESIITIHYSSPVSPDSCAAPNTLSKEDAMSWGITNRKLYSNGTPVFIVAIQFPMDPPGVGMESVYANWISAEYQTNRSRAGNAVFFTDGALMNQPPTSASGATNVTNWFSAHYTEESRRIPYFAVNMDFWNPSDYSIEPRGSHTWAGGYSNGSGHWTKAPSVDSLDIENPFSNTAPYDSEYTS
jgi:hypothetical protein